MASINVRDVDENRLRIALCVKWLLLIPPRLAAFNCPLTAKEAEKIVREWEQAKKENANVFAESEVLAIERKDKGFTLTVQTPLVET